MKKDDTVFLKHILDAIMSVSCKAGLRTSSPYMRSKITSMKIVLRKLTERVRVDSMEDVEEVGK